MSFKFEDERNDKTSLLNMKDYLTNSIYYVELMDYLKFEGIVSTKANGIQIY